MSAEKKITGKFKPSNSSEAKELANYFISLDVPFSYGVASTTGKISINAKFKGDEDYNAASSTFDKIERENDPQIELDLDAEEKAS